MRGRDGERVRVRDWGGERESERAREWGLFATFDKQRFMIITVTIGLLSLQG